ncbi:MAG TPA: YdcF family protein [Candidatus Dormibacteraeota bacterium]|nr:YdcF family protein [Candidatus Dormibacteraeota bacterium]
MNMLAWPAWRTLARGFALFLGGFTVLNVFGGLLRPDFDANLWWIDLRWVPVSAANLLLLCSGVLLIAFGLKPARGGCRLWATSSCAGILAVACEFNAIGFYSLLARGAVSSRLPISLSLLVCFGLVLVALTQFGNGRTEAAESRLVPSLLIATACLLAFPLAQMFCFGKTDYRRQADVAVVLGARVYADGRPSDALADRVRTACQLYREGITHKLLFSGGPGDGAIHETEAMKRMAIGLGVKPDDILVDEHGLNTQATAKNTEPMLTALGAKRVLVVSHFYHLPRIKLAYQRDGFEVYTVPAKETYILTQLPFNMAREVAALWVYYVRPLT